MTFKKVTLDSLKKFIDHPIIDSYDVVNPLQILPTTRSPYQKRGEIERLFLFTFETTKNTQVPRMMFEKRNRRWKEDDVARRKW